MKKMILTLAIAVSSFASFAGEEVSPKVLDAFKNEFSTAKNVEWEAGSNYFKAAFTYNDKYVFAYYSTEGDLLAITRHISPDVLPMSLQMDLKKEYEGYWISDLFEMAKNETTSYFITLENADTRLVLKSTGGSKWELHKKEKKA